MRQPLVVEWRHVFQIRQIAQGKEAFDPFVLCLPGLARFVISCGARKIFAFARVRRDVEPSPLQPGAIEHASRVKKISRGRERHSRNHGFQVRWSFYRGQPLHSAGIGQAECADVAIGPRLIGGPFNGVVAILAFVLVRQELAVGGVSSADILNNDGIPAIHGFVERGPFFCSKMFSVRRAVDEGREAPGCFGEPDIRTQNDAVAHGHGDVAKFWRRGQILGDNGLRYR